MGSGEATGHASPAEPSPTTGGVPFRFALHPRLGWGGFRRPLILLLGTLGYAAFYARLAQVEFDRVREERDIRQYGRPCEVVSYKWGLDWHLSPMRTVGVSVALGDALEVAGPERQPQRVSKSWDSLRVVSPDRKPKVWRDLVRTDRIAVDVALEDADERRAWPLVNVLLGLVAAGLTVRWMIHLARRRRAAAAVAAGATPALLPVRAVRGRRFAPGLTVVETNADGVRREFEFRKRDGAPLVADAARSRLVVLRAAADPGRIEALSETGFPFVLGAPERARILSAVGGDVVPPHAIAVATATGADAAPGLLVPAAVTRPALPWAALEPWSERFVLIVLPVAAVLCAIPVTVSFASHSAVPGMVGTIVTAAAVAGAAAWLRRRRRRFEVTETGVRVLRRGEVLEELTWSDLRLLELHGRNNKESWKPDPVGMLFGAASGALGARDGAAPAAAALHGDDLVEATLASLGRERGWTRDPEPRMRLVAADGRSLEITARCGWGLVRAVLQESVARGIDVDAEG